MDDLMWWVFPVFVVLVTAVGIRFSSDRIDFSQALLVSACVNVVIFGLVIAFPRSYDAKENYGVDDAADFEYNP